MPTVSRGNAPTLSAATAIYSHFSEVNGLIFCSGQIGQDAQGNVVEGGAAAETAQCIKNMTEVLKAAGSDWDHALKVNIFLKKMEDFGTINEVYTKMLPAEKPSRTCVQAGKLPRDVNIEIECIAAKI